MIKLNKETVKDKIYACWLGKNIGGTMGGPYEGCTDMQDIKGFITKPGEIVPNDDLDLQLVWLKAIETVGPYTLNEQILGEYWLSYIPPHWGEYGISKNNMRAGLMPPLSGEYENPYKHSNGAWIRTEVWACMAPASPDIAMKYARMDACVDHGAGEGTYAAMFVAAMESAAFVISDLRQLIDLGLSKLPTDCHMTRTMRVLLDCVDQGIDWKEARARIVEDCADLGWFQAPANVAFAMLGLLYGEGDFKKSMILAINCGDDTDCTAATLGSIFGILKGTAGIPADWKEHIGDSIVSVAIDRGSCWGLPKTCSQLTDRVFDMIPVMLKANEGNVLLADEDEIPEEDVKRFSEDAVAKELLSVPGRSFLTDFIWGECRVVFDKQDPNIAPGEKLPVKLIITNHMMKLQGGPKHLHLHWYLPEGWRVSGFRSNYVLQQISLYTSPTLELEGEIVAGEIVAANNQIVLRIDAVGRMTPGLIPMTVFG